MQTRNESLLVGLAYHDRPPSINKKGKTAVRGLVQYWHLAGKQTRVKKSYSPPTAESPPGDRFDPCLDRPKHPPFDTTKLAEGGAARD
jgi:hypothetical protein